jgi:hypothetical protein
VDSYCVEAGYGSAGNVEFVVRYALRCGLVRPGRVVPRLPNTKRPGMSDMTRC